jgi:outer membrane protein assembly factor BamB
LIVGGDQVYCFDANSSGSSPAPLWTYDDTNPSNQNWLGTQLVVYEGKVLAKGRGEIALYILDAVDGSLIHEVPMMAGFESGVAGYNGKAYAVGYNYGPRESYLDCVDIATGTVDWTWHSGYSYSGVDHWNGPLVEDGRVYFADYNGVIFCIAAEDQGSYSAGDEIWRYTVPAGNPVNGGVAKLGNHLFCGCAFASPVYCVSDDGDTASLAWSSSITGYFDAHMTVAITPSYPDGVVIAPTVNQQCIHFLDATNGGVIRTINTAEQMRSGASMAGEYVVLAGQYNLRVYH